MDIRTVCIKHMSVLATALVGTALAGSPGAVPPDTPFTHAARHEHGAVTLAIALDGSTLSVRLSAPALDLLGFERAPRAGAETARVEAVRALLASGERVVRWPAEAGCRQVKASVKAPAWAIARSGQAAQEEDRDHDHDHGDQQDAGHGTHANYDADYEFSCSAPARLAYLEAPIRQQLPAGTRLEVTVLTDRQQMLRELAIGQSRIELR